MDEQYIRCSVLKSLLYTTSIDFLPKPKLNQHSEGRGARPLCQRGLAGDNTEVFYIVNNTWPHSNSLRRPKNKAPIPLLLLLWLNCLLVHGLIGRRWLYTALELCIPLIMVLNQTLDIVYISLGKLSQMSQWAIETHNDWLSFTGDKNMEQRVMV